MTMARAEVMPLVERRRRWSRQDKERLVAASLVPGASVSDVARVAGIHVSQLFRWRKELCQRREPAAATLVPVEIVPSPAATADLSAAARPPARRRGDKSASPGLIEIELSSGHRVRVDGDVDGEALRRVLDVLVAR